MLRRLLGRREPVPLTLYTRVGCHLCEEMKATIDRIRVNIPWTLSEVDIDTDPALVERFGRSIPVLAIAGRVAFKLRLSEEDFVRKLRREAAAGEKR